ncbi:MAG: hypothetical protein WDN49_03230 [Acetobacteraceae bacterium]
MPIDAFLSQLAAAGLGTLPGTAAEILDDEVRAIICPDKVNTAQWLDVARAAHGLGLRTTSTIMYGHVEEPVSWARHLLALRDLQSETGGFTEFVPLPFVHMEAPMYLQGKARRGPTFHEAVLMHAVARLVLHPGIPNIQDVLGEDGSRRSSGLSRGRRERPWRHADERKHLPRGRDGARAGVSAGGDGSADTVHRARAAAAGHAVSPGCGGAACGRVGGRGAGAGGDDAAAEAGGCGVAARTMAAAKSRGP